MQILLILYPKHVVNYYGIIWDVTIFIPRHDVPIIFIVTSNMSSINILKNIEKSQRKNNLRVKLSLDMNG